MPQTPWTLRVDPVGNDVFKSKKIWGFRSNKGGAFGGVIVAQAVHAAAETVHGGFQLHSLHSYFIRPGDVDRTDGVIYTVERTRNGKSYCTRAVHASQGTSCIFTLIASFQKSEVDQPIWTGTATLDFQIAHIPQPADCTLVKDYFSQLLLRPALSPKERQSIMAQIEDEVQSKIQFAIFKPHAVLPPRLRPNSNWFRYTGPKPGQVLDHKLVLSYATDFNFIGSVSRALKLGERGQMKEAMRVSLDHSIFFYSNDLDVTEWMLFQMEPVAARYGRGLVFGRVFDRNGILLAACTQEGVVRAKL